MAVSEHLTAPNEAMLEVNPEALEDGWEEGHLHHQTKSEALEAPKAHTLSSSDVETVTETPPTEEDDSRFLVEFGPDDPENPYNWSKTKKWVVSISACLFTALASAGGSFFASGDPSMARELGSSREVNALGISLYNFGFGIAPLLLASLSEEYGRRPMYSISAIIFTLFFLPIGLAQNIQTVIIARFIQGCAGSTGSTMVGGTMADIWETHERGLPMSIFALSSILSTSLAPIIAGWEEQFLGFRWIEWIAMICSGVLTVWLVLYGSQETRGSILLVRRAKKLRKETGDDRYHTAFHSPSVKELFLISATRPIHLLFTEPIVASFSLWIGFVWGVLFGLIESIPFVFKSLYGFDSGQQGSVFAAAAVGVLFAYAWNMFYQEPMYKKNVDRIGPEARMYSAPIFGIAFSIGAFIYGWTSFSHVHWIGPCVGIAIILASVFTIYLAAFNYLADAYLLYASSALAGQSLARNMSSTAFPLFTIQMYEKLGFRWASSLLGFVGLALAFIPFVLFAYGPQIRGASKFASEMAKLAEENKKHQEELRLHSQEHEKKTEP